jgi:hypothetical protein
LMWSGSRIAILQTPLKHRGFDGRRKNSPLVPMNILVCATCGGRYYDRKSMRKIEEIRKKLKNKKLNVEEVGKPMRANAA